MHAYGARHARLESDTVSWLEVSDAVAAREDGTRTLVPHLPAVPRAQPRRREVNLLESARDAVREVGEVRSADADGADGELDLARGRRVDRSLQDLDLTQPGEHRTARYWHGAPRSAHAAWHASAMPAVSPPRGKSSQSSVQRRRGTPHAGERRRVDCSPVRAKCGPQ